MIAANSSKNDLIVSAMFVLCLLTGFLIFWPALTGPFLFDDYPILKEMAQKGGITNLNHLLEYVVSYEGGSGRPLAMISFLLNDYAWPTNPWSFKYTNLLIHLLNGVLVFILFTQLFNLVILNRLKVRLLSIIAMAIWILHPLQLSTMMLVVQRMTELMATFALLGLICYLHGRKQVVNKYFVKGYGWMSFGMVGCGIFSVLSKETGILLPLYVLTIEETLMNSYSVRLSYWKVWSSMFIFFPLTMVVVALFVNGFYLDGYAVRDFTLTERLLTEPRILLDYVSSILFPRLSGSGVFHDDYLISTSLFEPISTFLALTFWIILFGFVLAFRNRYSILAFSVLWFLAGHVLEATFLPLELYFEHRNYLPMLGPLFGLIYGFSAISSKRLQPVLIVSLLLFIGILAATSYQSSKLWGNEGLLAKIWLYENPTSQRAKGFAALYALKKGDYPKARELLLELSESGNQGSLLAELQLALIDCRYSNLKREQVDRFVRRAKLGEFSNGLLETITHLRIEVGKQTCPIMNYDDLISLIDSLFKNPRYSNNLKAQQFLWYEKGSIATAQKLINPAMEYMDNAYRLIPRVDIALMQAAWLFSAGIYDGALHYVEVARNTKQGILSDLLISREEDFSEFESLIKKAVQEKNAGH